MANESFSITIDYDKRIIVTPPSLSAYTTVDITVSNAAGVSAADLSMNFSYRGTSLQTVTGFIGFDKWYEVCYTLVG